MKICYNMRKGACGLDKYTLNELNDIVFDLECEARRNSTKFLTEGDHSAYMYWRGKRSALGDISIKILELLQANK